MGGFPSTPLVDLDGASPRDHLSFLVNHVGAYIAKKPESCDDIPQASRDNPAEMFAEVQSLRKDFQLLHTFLVNVVKEENGRTAAGKLTQRHQTPQSRRDDDAMQNYGLAVRAAEAQQSALGKLVVKEEETRQHLSFIEANLERLKAMKMDINDSDPMISERFDQYVINPVVQRKQMLQDELQLLQQSRKHGLANMLYLRSLAQTELLPEYADRIARTEEIFEKMLGQSFSLKVNFSSRTLVNIVDPKEVEEQKLIEQRKALAKGGAIRARDKSNDATVTHESPTKPADTALEEAAPAVRSFNPIGTETVLRRVRDVVDQLATFADGARAEGLDEKILLRQPTQASNENTRLLEYAERMHLYAQQGKAMAEGFANFIVSRSRQSECPIADATLNQDAAMKTEAVSDETVNDIAIRSIVQPLESLLPHVFENHDGDFAEATSYLSVRMEVRSIAQMYTLLLAILDHSSHQLANGRSQSSPVKESDSHKSPESRVDFEDCATFADVLSFAVTPTSAGQIIHAARGAAAWPCRQRLGVAGSSSLGVEDADSHGDIPLENRTAQFRVNRASSHIDGAERFGVVLACRLLADLPSQIRRVGKARGAAGANGFIFEIHVQLSDFASSTIGASGVLTTQQSLRLYDQNTLYPLIETSRDKNRRRGDDMGGNTTSDDQELIIPPSEDDDWASYGLLNPKHMENDKVPPPPVVPVRVGLQSLRAGLVVQFKFDGMEAVAKSMWPDICHSLAEGCRSNAQGGLLRNISLSQCGLDCAMLAQFCAAFLNPAAQQEDNKSLTEAGERGSESMSSQNDTTLRTLTLGTHVAYLDLSHNDNLLTTAEVMRHVGRAFPNIRKLCCDRCGLHDNIPVDEKLWAHFRHLRRGITLAYNKVSGKIPLQLFEQCSQLTQLWLNNNELTGPVPPEIGQLRSLEVRGRMPMGIR